MDGRNSLLIDHLLPMATQISVISLFVQCCPATFTDTENPVVLTPRTLAEHCSYEYATIGITQISVSAKV